MKYITHRRFKGMALCGEVNIPAMTGCELIGGLICCNGKAICFIDSENSHQYFARDDDGNGMLRGKLTRAIQQRLAKNDNAHQDRWDKVWDDLICNKYRKKDFDDYFLWNHEFFNASIEDLKYIASLIGVKEEKI